MNKRTDELMQMLKTEDTLEDYFTANQDELIDCSLEIYLNQLLNQYHVMKNEVIFRSGLNQIYGYQIFAGTKKPSRDKLIALIFGFPLCLKDAQRLLRIGGVSELYPRIKRDSIILFGMKKNLSIQELDDLLFELEEKTIL
jgi:hypothetical protein